MGSVEVAARPHAVCVPYPSQGHVSPMMQLAKLLYSQGFHITFVNTEFNHKRLVRSNAPASVQGLDHFRFETIPDGLPPSGQDATQDVIVLCDSIQKTCLGPFLELLAKLNASPEVPPVKVIVADGVMSFGMKAAEELGIPGVRFWTASACGMMGYLNYSELARREICPFKDENFEKDGTLDTKIDWIEGMPSDMRLKDLPSFVRTSDPDDIMFNFLGSEAQSCFQASSIIFNSFDDLEHEVLDELKKRHPHIYTIGPLSLLGHQHVQEREFKSFKSSLWKEDTSCLKWLNQWEPDSVIYVNYGSITTMTSEQFEEFAWGLANSKHPFLWILRPDVLNGESITLPDEFFNEIQGRGLITSWCAQGNVLRHPSVGAFLTHCGWNSMVETISGGIPVICWPFFAEQQTNCRYSYTTWDMGMEVGDNVKREKIEMLVKEMMESEKGKKLRQNTKTWRKKAEEATNVGGSSYINFASSSKRPSSTETHNQKPQQSVCCVMNC